MGLVALSVFALAFAACAGSEGNNSGTPGTGPGGLTSNVVPTSFSVLKNPDTYGGTVLEGQLVDLTGIKLNVRTSDNNWKEVTDLKAIKIKPEVYITGVNVVEFNDPLDFTKGVVTTFVPNNTYTLYYTENGTTVEQVVPASILGTHLYLLDLDITGQMTKNKYRIDDIPDFAGLTVNGVYSLSNNVAYGGRWNENLSHLDPQQGDYIRRPIYPDTKYPEYRWAWVWNATPGMGSFLPNDQPGVLLSIGSLGQIFSKIRGGDAAAVNYSYLKGERVEIAELYQVDKIEVSKTPSYDKYKVFYDDPTLIGAIPYSGNPADFLYEMEKRETRWIDNPLYDLLIKVTYSGAGGTNEFSLAQLKTMNPALAIDLLNYGEGASWANLEFYPITYGDRIRIDVTRDTKERLDVEDTKDFDIYTWVKEDDYDDESNTGTLAVGDGGWSQWAEVRADRSALRFYWRGKTADLPVKIYNRPQSLEITEKSGVPFNPVLMNGYDYVYRRPEGMADFMNKFTVKVNYIVNGTSDTASRNDVVKDISEGICRAFVTVPALVYSPDTVQAPGGSIISVANAYPTLYSDTIFNWKDDTDIGQALARLWGEVGNLADPWLEAAQQSILNKDSTDAYLAARSKTQKGVVYFAGFSGNPETVRVVKNTVAAIAITGYPDNPEP